MLEFTNKYRGNIKYSQNGEESIILEVLRRTNLKPGRSVEFGGCDGYYCSNTRLLEEHGWEVRMFDVNPTSALVEKREITPANVNNLPDCQILSIDIDNDDLLVWQAYKGLPDIVIIEINSSLSPHCWEVPGNRGCSYLPAVTEGLKKGYFLLCHTGNEIFVLNKHRHLFPEILGDGIGNCELYFDTSYLPR
jgi:hypothetical protein